MVSVSLLRQTIKRRLLVPMLRAMRDPDHATNGVLVGMVVAMTPTLGVQMAMVAVVWGLFRVLRVPFRFNVAVAMAWTWATNVFTAPPLYYVYYLTGRLLLLDVGDDSSFDSFKHSLQSTVDSTGTLQEALTWYESMWNGLMVLYTTFGLPLVVGCIPWVIIVPWICWWWARRFTRRIAALAHSRKAHRIAEKAKRLTKLAAHPTQIVKKRPGTAKKSCGLTNES